MTSHTLFNDEANKLSLHNTTDMKEERERASDHLFRVVQNYEVKGESERERQ